MKLTPLLLLIPLLRSTAGTRRSARSRSTSTRPTWKRWKKRSTS